MITLRPARLDEKVKTYQWLCLSDTTPMHMGAPHFPENPVPSWAQFDADFAAFYYLPEYKQKGAVLIILQDGIEIGCVCYTMFHLKPGFAELDIWLSKKEFCGNGWGTEAIIKGMEQLENDLHVTRCLIRPSEANRQAIRAYEKAGFYHVADKQKTVTEFLLPEYMHVYGDGDYGMEKTAVLVRDGLPKLK
ncbi:MAG: GNAT family N-acetyltransferase [Ignavibacteriales bacterium]|nr:GNAT family N-acetyltransferase [Ignavibacteriales bacterium]